MEFFFWWVGGGGGGGYAVLGPPAIQGTTVPIYIDLRKKMMTFTD